MANSWEVKVKRTFSMKKREIEGMALKIKLALGFFFRIILKTEDLKSADAIHLTMRIHMK